VLGAKSLLERKSALKKGRKLKMQKEVFTKREATIIERRPN